MTLLIKKLLTEETLPLTLLHKTLILALNLCTPKIDKITSNFLSNSLWKIGITFPNIY